MEKQINIPAGEAVLLVIALASKKGEIRNFSENALYAIFKKLTEEFPDYFQGLHWHSLVGGFPYCGEFEDILFRAGASDSLLRTGTMMNEFLVNERIVKTIEESAKKHHGEDVIIKMEPLVERFIELYSKN